MESVVGGSLGLRAEVAGYIGQSMISDRDIRYVGMEGISLKVSEVVKALGSPYGDSERLKTKRAIFSRRILKNLLDEFIWILSGTGELVLMSFRRGNGWELFWYESGEWEEELDSVYGCLRERAAVG